MSGRKAKTSANIRAPSLHAIDGAAAVIANGDGQLADPEACPSARDTAPSTSEPKRSLFGDAEDRLLRGAGGEPLEIQHCVPPIPGAAIACTAKLKQLCSSGRVQRGGRAFGARASARCVTRSRRRRPHRSAPSCPRRPSIGRATGRRSMNAQPFAAALRRARAAPSSPWPRFASRPITRTFGIAHQPRRLASVGGGLRSAVDHRRSIPTS